MEIVCKHCNTRHFLSDDRIPLETKIGKCKQCSAPITVLGKNTTVSIESTPIQSTPPEPEATKQFMTPVERLMDLLDAHATDGFYIGSSIPKIKLENAIAHFPIDPKATVIALIDCTSWGSCKRGLAITDYGLYWNNQWGVYSSKTYLSWEEFITNKSKFGIDSFDSILLGNNIRLGIYGRMKKDNALNLFHALADLMAEFDTHNITNNSVQSPPFKFDFTKASIPLSLHKTALQMKPTFHHGSCPNCGHCVSWKHYVFSGDKGDSGKYCCEVCVTELCFDSHRANLCTGLLLLWMGVLFFFLPILPNHNSFWIFLILLCIGIKWISELQYVKLVSPNSDAGDKARKDEQTRKRREVLYLKTVHFFKIVATVCVLVVLVGAVLGIVFYDDIMSNNSYAETKASKNTDQSKFVVLDHYDEIYNEVKNNSRGGNLNYDVGGYCFRMTESETDDDYMTCISIAAKAIIDLKSEGNF